LWRRLDRIRAVVGAKAITRTDLYANERDPAVVAEGSRLRMGLFGRSTVGRSLLILIALSIVILIGGFAAGIVLFILGP
jgi:hypothetical protein